MIATTTVLKAAAAGVAAVGGLELYKHFHPQLQSLRHVGPTGAPIQTVVPVTDSATKPGVAAAPLPPNNGSAATFTPPPATPNGTLGLEPTVITPSGAANLSIDSVSDVQNALTTLGVAKLAADGKPGPATAAAVTVFQSAHGLPSTGIIDPPLKAALQSALASLAGTQKHIGQSLPVQAAAVGASTPDSPLGASIVSAGLHKIVSLFQGLFHSDVGAEGADLPKTDDHKAALIKLQRVLNLLGASPPLDESGTMTPETTAAIKCFQVTYGLVADGVPLQKTVAAMALAVDPAAQAAILPSVPKAADHVASLAATEDPKSEIKAPLAAAAQTLSAAAAAPTPTDSQLHASTAAAHAATAASASPEVPVAAPLAAAAAALATAAATPTPDPAAIAAAASHVANASTACTGTSCPSLDAAASHLAAAASAPNAADAGDHLQAAATHLSNAAGGAPAAGATAGFGWGGGWGGVPRRRGWGRRVRIPGQRRRRWRLPGRRMGRSTDASDDARFNARAGPQHGGLLPEPRAGLSASLRCQRRSERSRRYGVGRVRQCGRQQSPQQERIRLGLGPVARAHLVFLAVAKAASSRVRAAHPWRTRAASRARECNRPPSAARSSGACRDGTCARPECNLRTAVRPAVRTSPRRPAVVVGPEPVVSP